MEIEVGEYVRTTDGEIHKIKSIEDNFIEYENGYGIFVREIDYIINHSKEIIDLIEKGDYVNGKRVIYVASIENKYDEEELCVFVEETQDCIEAKDIKSIVTKEMMKSVEYRIN